MRIFGRSSTFRLQPSSPADAVSGVAQVIGSDIRHDGIDLDIDIGATAQVEILCRQEQLEQVLINLILNARDAIRAKRAGNPAMRGEIKVSSFLDGDDRSTFMNLVVQDNAGGIPEAILAKVFQPFFTTKPAGQGTGLGLSVSFGIVRDHGGTLSVRNDERGAVFTIRLPCTRKVAEQDMPQIRSA
jgi:signal transduction histidine kinase